MSLLSGDKFSAKGKGPGGSGVPKQLRISRVLMFVQGALGLLMHGFIVYLNFRQQQVSDAELVKIVKKQLGAKQYKKLYGDNPVTQETYPYTTLYLLAAAMIVLLLVLIFCALRVTRKQKSVRLVTAVTEGVLIAFSLWQLGQIGCALILPAMAVIVLLFSRRVKEWYDTPASA